MEAELDWGDVGEVAGVWERESRCGDEASLGVLAPLV